MNSQNPKYPPMGGYPPCQYTDPYMTDDYYMPGMDYAMPVEAYMPEGHMGCYPTQPWGPGMDYPQMPADPYGPSIGCPYMPCLPMPAPPIPYPPHQDYHHDHHHYHHELVELCSMVYDKVCRLEERVEKMYPVLMDMYGKVDDIHKHLISKPPVKPPDEKC